MARSAAAIVILTALVEQASGGNDTLARVPFDVEAAISLERLLTVEEGQRTGSWVLWSADRSQFVVRTRRGDLARNVNIESLWVLDTADVVRYLDAAATGKPKPRAVIERAVSVDWGLLSGVQWIGDSEIGFISADETGRRQVFRADTRTGLVSQLTQSPTDVASFAVTADRLVYFASSPVPADLVVPVVDQSLLQLQRWDKDPRLAPLELRVLSLVSQGTIETDLPPARLLPVHRKIWPSPDGLQAIVLGPDVDASQRATAQVNTASWNLLDRIRFYVVDLSTGAARPLLDAPSGWLARGCTPLEASWRSEQSVIISNTLLPIEGGAVQASAPFPVATEVDVTTGAVVPIVELPPCL
ncbi:MAG: hypothetical protein HC872_05340, partial [Gammaproteobacteria bacterium]|nr:hypothetical protein [Gammaproteobacteria bacterium]